MKLASHLIALFSSGLLAACLVSTAAASQEFPSPFYRLDQGAIGPTGLPLRLVREPMVNRFRDSAIWVQAAVTPLNGIPLLISDDRVVVEGRTALPGGGGFTVTAFDTGNGCLDAQGKVWSTVELQDAQGQSSNALFQGGRAVIRNGQLSGAPQVPPGTIYESVAFGGLTGASETACYALLHLRRPGLASELAMTRLVTNGNGQLLSEDVLLTDGTPAPPPLSGTLLGNASGQFSRNGHSVLYVNYVPSSGGPLRTVLVFDGSTVLELGDASPVPGKNWTEFGGARINDSGDWAISGLVGGDEWIIVKNGLVDLRESDIRNDLLPIPIDRVDVVGVSSLGKVAFGVRMESGGFSVDYGYFFNGRPVALSHRGTFDGVPATYGNSFISGCSVDPDGVNAGLILFTELTPDTFTRTAIGIPLDQSDPFCSNGATSLGELPRVSVHGSPWVADGTDFEILTNFLPPQAFALNLASAASGSGSVMGTLGTLCVGGQVFRSAPLQTSSGGAVRSDLSEMLSSPAQGPIAGDTWYFQTWYRDSDAAGSPVSRFTEAVSVDFL